MAATVAVPPYAVRIVQCAGDLRAAMEKVLMDIPHSERMSDAVSACRGGAFWCHKDITPIEGVFLPAKLAHRHRPVRTPL